MGVHVRPLADPDRGVDRSGPLGDGAEVYAANCSSCHGAGGEGGIGYPFTGGEVLRTFPHIEDQLRFVYSGSAEYSAAGIAVYGDPDREGGVHATGARGQMPGFGAEAGGALTEAEILAVVCHERYTLSGADPTGQYLEEYERWCSPEAPGLRGSRGRVADVREPRRGARRRRTGRHRAGSGDAGRGRTRGRRPGDRGDRRHEQRGRRLERAPGRHALTGTLIG